MVELFAPTTPHTMSNPYRNALAELSPAAQSVLDAFAADNYGVWLEGDPDRIAAALRAVADQVVPDEITWASPKEQLRHWPSDAERAGEQGMAAVVRHRLLAIAAELEAQ